MIVLGFLAKWYIGSAVANVSMPMPIPAPNIIENHEKLENSGLSSSWPNRIFPAAGHNASAKQRITKNAMT